jgi:2-dehydropantoate 2-reductase
MKRRSPGPIEGHWPRASAAANATLACGRSLPKVVFVGAGAMGSLFAARLAASPGEVWVYDVWPAHIEAIRERGLRVSHRGGERPVSLRATGDPAEPGIADILFLFVKYSQTEQAMRDARPLLSEGTVIVTLQNGLGNVETIRRVVPGNKILFGFTTLTSELLGPGRIDDSFAGRGETYLWPEDATPDASSDRVIALLNGAGVHTVLAPDIELRIWKKLVVNCCLNPLCAIADLTVGDLVAQPDIWPVFDGVIAEIVSVAERKGIGLDRRSARGFLEHVASESGAHLPSMVMDVRARRATEIDCLNGAIVREAERHGIDAPCNRTLRGVIKVLEQTYAKRGA